MGEQGSVTSWIGQLQAGAEGTVQQEIWNRYFEQLVAIACRRLQGSPRREQDEEDAVLSAFDSFFRRVQEGQFPLLHDRGNLWPLLVKITIRKSLNQRRRAQAKKRQALGESALQQDQNDHDGRLLEQIATEAPSPEMAALAAEQARLLLACLEKESLLAVAQLKLEGFSNREIAERLEVIERTVERRLVLIRKLWAEHAGGAVD